MKLTDKEVLDKIQQHRGIIVSGTTEGRKRIRKLLIENLGQQRIIDTRNYHRRLYLKNGEDARLIEIYSLWNTTQGKEYKVLNMFVNDLQKKKKPIVIDSFTDVQSIVFNHLKKASDGKVFCDWNLVRYLIKQILTKLKKHKKKVILFTDIRSEFIDARKKIERERPACMQFLINEADLIIQVTDEHNVWIKEKPIITLEAVLKARL